mgnify:FL=1
MATCRQSQLAGIFGPAFISNYSIVTNRVKKYHQRVVRLSGCRGSSDLTDSSFEISR